MTFTLFSTLATLGGIALLAIALALLQRLRVQHREVEVLSTLFWQAALKETRARVFVRRFRHWPAWLLLVVIASLLWLLLAGPRWQPLNPTRHIVLLDGSVANKTTLAIDLELATTKAASLPIMQREIVTAGPHLQTLLAPGDPIELTNLRANLETTPASTGIHWALETLSSRASATTPLAIHIIGDVAVDQAYLESLPPELIIYRIQRPPSDDQALLRALGVSNAKSGNWQMVDVLFASSTPQVFDGQQISITVDDLPIQAAILPTDNGDFLIEDLPAQGGVLKLRHGGEQLGSLTLPHRDAIRVSFETGVPNDLRELILLDPACQETQSDPEILIGESEFADFRLTPDDQSAFQIESELPDPQAALAKLIDELALTQIDATALAERSGRLVDVQVTSGEKRKLSMWKTLFTPAFNFQQSRACPILVARSIRWLANRPPLVSWAEQGMRLPDARPAFDRVIAQTTTTSDGRTLQVTRLTRSIAEPSEIIDSPNPGLLAGIGITTWLGLVAMVLLLTEWVLYQRGRLP